METSTNGKGVLLGIVAGVGYPPDLSALEGRFWSTRAERSGIKILDIPRPGEIPFWDRSSSLPLMETQEQWLEAQGNSLTVRILECRYGILDGQLKTSKEVDQQLSLCTKSRSIERIAIATLKDLLMNKHEFRMYGLRHPYGAKNHR